jgi:hypothetical protein
MVPDHHYKFLPLLPLEADPSSFGFTREVYGLKRADKRWWKEITRGAKEGDHARSRNGGMGAVTRYRCRCGRLFRTLLEHKKHKESCKSEIKI